MRVHLGPEALLALVGITTGSVRVDVACAAAWDSRLGVTTP